MKHRFSFTLLVIFALLVSGIFAQDVSQFVLNGNGARAAGMGYAFTGLADDATAISWNSAGLTQLYAPEASIIARFGFGSLDPQYDDVNLDVTTGSKFQLNFASIAIPFSAGEFNVVGGIAYRRVFDFTQNFEIKAGEAGFMVENITDNSGGIDGITPALGIQFSDMFSVGASVNILTGSTDYKSEFRVTGFEPSIEEYSEEYSGVAVEIGALVKASPQFQIGANLGLPNTITFTQKMRDSEDFEYDLKVPFFFSIGAAFRASDQVTLAADYRSRPWSSGEVEVEGESGTIEEWLQFLYNDPELKVYNANSFHVGLEYLAESGNSVIPLRLGFFTQPSPGEDEKRDQISFTGLTAGLGLIMGQVILDGSFEYLFGTYAGDTDENDNAVDFKQTDFRVTIGGTIHFGQN
jgi:long-subunit fatty acid transport protein